MPHYNSHNDKKHSGKKHGDMRGMLSDTPEEAYEQAQDMGFEEVHSHRKNGEVMFMPGPSHEALSERVGDEGGKMDTEACGINGECDSMMSGASGQDAVTGQDLSAVDGLELESAEDNAEGRLF